MSTVVDLPEIVPSPLGADDPDHPLRVDRWRPHEAGLINVWRYADELFTFHNGRLLLRGPNGSGKSMALELLLPFLLDANARPSRLTSAARSRGGLYDRFMAGHGQGRRAGFLWVTFTRGDDPDGPVFTCGVRLSASSSSKGKVDPDWFTTVQRPGHDLTLLTEQRIPLTRAELAAAIGSDGAVYRTADEYRTAVRAALYPTFSAQQYEAMIITLLALRREKVSEDLDAKKLSDVLTAALPALDDGELHQVAEGFEKLDRRRDALDQLGSDIDHVDRLAKAQRDYARVVAAWSATAVRSAESRRDDVTKRERTAREALAATDATLAEVRREFTACEHRQDELTATLSALTSSEDYKSGERLIEIGKRRDRLADDVDGFDRRVTAAAQRLEKATQRLDQAARELEAAAANRDGARRDLATIADEVDAAAVAAETDDERVGVVLPAWSQGRRGQVREVRQAVRAHDGLTRGRDLAEQAREKARSQLDVAATQLRQAADDHQAAVEGYAAALAEWFSACVLLGPVPDGHPGPEPDGAGGVTELGARADSPGDVERLVHSWAGDHTARLDVRQADVDGRIRTLDENLAEVQARRDELAAGKLIEPIPPPWRSERDQAGGVPLWRLVDIRPDAEPAIAGIEAALEASGLLDAIVSPDGGVRLADGEADIYLLAPTGSDSTSASPPRSGSAGPGSTNLGSALLPIGGEGVPVEVIEAALAAVALVDTVEPDHPGNARDATASGAVGRDGTFAVAGLWGRGSVGDTRFLGATAREQERQRRLAEIDAQLAELNRLRSELGTERRQVDSDREVLAAELASCPTGQPVTEAAETVTRADQHKVDAEQRVVDTTTELHDREDDVKQSLRRLSQLTAEHRLPSSEDALDTYETGLQRFDQFTTILVTRIGEVTAASAKHTDRLSQVAEHDETVTEARALLAERQRGLREAEAEYAALESTAGAPFAEIQNKIAAAEREQAEARTRAKALADQRSELDQRLGGLREAVDRAEADRAEAEADRAGAHETYRAVVADKLVSDAGVDGEQDLSTLTSTLESARLVATGLGSVATDDNAFSRADGRVREVLLVANQSVGGRIDLTFDAGENRWMLLRAVKDGMRRPVTEIAASLRDDLQAAKAELLEEERRLFDETLTGGVRREVAKRIRQANDLVGRINDQMGLVKTAAAGVQVRLKWEVQPEQPDAVRTARGLLLRGDLRDEDREALHEFFRARVEQAQLEGDPAATWEDRLRDVLDYRAWHHFSFQIAHRDWDGYLPATSARLQKLSTGERSMALHLPMLASVAAHYDGGPSEVGCPRIVLLDELFVGVDVANRNLLFSLFATWNLDAVFTSHDEWCAYQSLDGIAIHNLHGGEADESVTTTRFVWDGHTRTVHDIE